MGFNSAFKELNWAALYSTYFYFPHLRPANQTSIGTVPSNEKGWTTSRFRIPKVHFTNCTGRFKMFRVITNIYNKTTKGTTLMELFTSTEKLENFFFSTARDVRCVHHRWHGTHRYDIQVLATHGSTWVFSARTDTQFQKIVYTTHEWSCL